MLIIKEVGTETQFNNYKLMQDLVHHKYLYILKYNKQLVYISGNNDTYNLGLTASQLTDIQNSVHTHSNKSVLDNLSTDQDDNLNFKNQQIGNITEEQVRQMVSDMLDEYNIEQSVRIVSKDNKYILTTDNRIFTSK